MAVGAVVARILTQYSDKGSKAAQKDIAKLGKNIDRFAARAAKSFLIVGAATAALAVKLGKDAVKGAMADEKQQAALAIALRNTTGATQEAIDANVKYLDSLELQVAIDNEKLIPALQKLVTATGDLGQAQQLLRLATDVAAASGKDLSSVATALSRALGGNFTALTRLGLPLDEAAIKAKDFAKIQAQLAKLSAGQASAAANTFAGRMETLRLRVNQVMDEVGYALIPVLEDLVEYIDSDVIPAIQRWVRANKDELAESLRESIKLAGEFAKAALALGEFLVKYKEVFAVLATVVGGLVFVAKLNAAIFALKTMGTAVTLIGRALGIIPPAAAAAGAGVAGAGATGAAGMAGLSTVLMTILTRLGYIGLAVAGFIGLFKGLDYLLDKSHKADIKRQAEKVLASKVQTKQILKDFQAVEKATSGSTVAEQNRTKEILKGFKAIEKATKSTSKLVKTPVKTPVASQLGLTSEQQIQVEQNAAKALLDRQLKNNEIDKERLKNLKEEILLQKVRNDLAARYEDILKALADGKVDSKDIAILAGKWGVTTEAAKTYVETIFAVEDGTVSDDEIIQLAKSWGSTQAQAAQYLDFFVALNDGVLSDAEIEKLKAKWKLTEDQVRMYADFVGVVNDGKLTDNEIEKLKAKWILTTDQVVDYIKKIGSPVSYSGTLIDPARAAEIGWLNATAALQRYLDLLKAGTGAVITTVTAPVTTTDGNSAAAIAAAAIAAVQAGDAAVDAANAVAESEAALAKAMQEAADAAAESAKFTEELTKLFPDLMKSVAILEASQDAKEISGRTYTTDAELDRILASVGGFESNFGTTGGEYDERFKFKAFSPTMDASGGGFQNSMAGSVTVNINVEGSVTTEQDLVSAVRDGLLGTQYNGSQITLQAI